MENEYLTIKVTAWVSNLPINIEFKNIVKIYPNQVIEESAEDESGVVTLLESYRSPLTPNSHIRVFPRSFTSSHLSELLRDEQVLYYGYLGQQIANVINHALANDDSLREPVFVTVNVKFIIERRLILLPIVSAPRGGASAEVLQRLVEEQSVESTCSICIENLSGNIIRMPQCLHMFHQDCLFEWLGRHNSCPLCRRVP